MTYNPITGEFYRDGVRVNVAPHPRTGYINIRFEGKKWRAHRLAFHLMGLPVPETVDHANRNKTHNQWCNLRAATRNENARNGKTRRDGLKGAYPQAGAWMARISINGVGRYLGRFATEREAHEKYREVAVKVSGEFACP